MWVIPALAERGFNLKNGVPPTEVDITINMRKPFTKKATEIGDSTKLPAYTFSTESIFNNINETTGKNAVNLINIVPNPYYATSAYESSAIDSRVKITNLPPKATISVYTLNGALVRRIKKDDNETFVDWDLKNSQAIPIASGVYLIHVEVEGVGKSGASSGGSSVNLANCKGSSI